MTDDDAPTREQLLTARDDLRQQLYLVSQPAAGRDRNPPLEAKLQAMLKEIDDCLAEMDATDAQRS